MIGLGPHPMTTTDWVFIGSLQVALVLLTAFAIWLASLGTGQRSGR